MKKICFIITLVFSISFLFAQPPCQYIYGATEEDSITCRQRMFFFTEFYRSKSYTDAYESWQYLIQKAPCSLDRIYSWALTMFDNLIKEEEDSARRELLIDSLLYTYDVRSIYFPDMFTAGSSLGIKAVALSRFRPQQSKQALEWIVQSVGLENENTSPLVWKNYFQLAKSSRDITIISEACQRALHYIPIAIQNATKSYENTNEALKKLKQQLENEEINRSYYERRAKTLGTDTSRLSKHINDYRSVLTDFEDLAH